MIYLDNAATSRFKPRSVLEALSYDLTHSANSGRSGHRDAIAAGLKIENCRDFIKRTLHAEDADVIFTKSCTEALNLAIFGLIKGGERVLTSANEHNSVLRPLAELERSKQITLDILPQSADGKISLDDIAEHAKHADIMTFGGACNVTGVETDLREVGKIAKRNNAILIADGAQCVPLADIDFEDFGISMLACPGHKGLHALQGTGFLLKRSDIQLKPLIFGGTGTYSSSVYQPLDAPEAYEAGTQFAGGIAALHAGAKWSFDNAAHTRKKFENMTEQLVYNLKMTKSTVYSVKNKYGIAAFNIGDTDSSLVAQLLDDNDIAVRSGLHCAPLVHKHLGTLEQGAVRVSLGVETTPSDITSFCTALEGIIRRLKS